jgi:hypothetical protein
MAKLAKIFDMPIVVSAVAGEGGQAATIVPDIEAGYGPYRIHHRTTANSLLNEGRGECAGDFRRPLAQDAIGVVFEMAAG